MNIISEPELLRDHLVEYLGTKDDLSAARILSRKVADLRNEITRTLARDGLLVLVMVSDSDARGDQSARVVLDPVHIIIRVTENVLLNKTGVSAHYVATRIVAELTQYKPPYPWAALLIPQRPTLRELNIISSLEDDDDSDEYAGWDVRFTTKIALPPRSKS